MSSRRGPLRRLSLRQRAGVWAHVAVVAALVPAYAAAGVASRWDDPVLLAALVALGVLALRHEVALPTGVTFEALSALSLIAVALLGPLPALVVSGTAVAVNAALGRERLLRAGNLANAAAYGGYALAAALILPRPGADAASLEGVARLLAAGLAMLLVNWALGPALYVTLWLGERPRTVLVMLRDGLPAGMAMMVLGAAAVALTAPLGILALGLFAV